MKRWWQWHRQGQEKQSCGDILKMRWLLKFSLMLAPNLEKQDTIGNHIKNKTNHLLPQATATFQLKAEEKNGTRVRQSDATTARLGSRCPARCPPWQTLAHPHSPSSSSFFSSNTLAFTGGSLNLGNGMDANSA